jgi:hypothetical protein
MITRPRQRPTSIHGAQSGAIKPSSESAKVATLHTESIVSSPSDPDTRSRCVSCGAPLAADQRYCLQCGERQVPMSSFLLGSASSPPTPGDGQPPPATASTPPALPGGAASPPGPASPQSAFGERGWALPLIAGVGVLLLAMGVGVLIGRAGSAGSSRAPAQVITLGAASTGTSTTAASESFKSDWPSARNGYTVQLQTLPQSGTTAAQVSAAKSAASAKGASAVGALRSGDFSSLTAGSYVIYSGVDSTKALAQKALAGLHKKFPGAKVIRVSNAAGSKAPPSSGGSGSNISHPAPPSVLEHPKGKSYEERSKNLPNVISTG